VLLALIALVVVVYLLGEQWGRESPTRTKYLKDIVTKKAELENLKTDLTQKTTSPFLHLIIVVALIVLLFMLAGPGGFGGEFHSHHRYR
jgi:hypothetical protein